MKNAKEMKAITEENIDKYLNKCREAAQECAEHWIAFAIENAAKDREYSLEFRVANGIHIETVVEILEQNGYKVKTIGRTLKINWF